jgi:hypothetical protein
MNDLNHITNEELRELETALGRFDGFKSELVPNENALRAALAEIPSSPASASSRRSWNWNLHPIIVPAFAVAFALVLLIAPRGSDPTPSPIAMDIAAEEQAVDAVTNSISDPLATTAVERADADLDTLATLL